MAKWSEKSFGSDEYAHCLDGDDVVTGINLRGKLSCYSHCVQFTVCPLRLNEEMQN